jgi:hypothetical protein
MSKQLRWVDIAADLNARESDGYCWSLLSDAADPSLIVPGAIVVAGEPDTPALAEIVDFNDIGHDVIVRFRILPGSVEDYEYSLARSRIPTEKLAADERMDQT